MEEPVTTPVLDTEEFMEQVGTAAADIRLRGESYTAIGSTGTVSASPAPPPMSSGDDCQWLVGPNGAYKAISATVPQLPAGVYNIGYDDRNNPIPVKTELLTDELVPLPDTAAGTTIKLIRRFWDARANFRALGMLFKRGIMLYGPPGSGKTICVIQMSRELTELDGLTLFAEKSPREVTTVLQTVRRVEPERPLICILEDFDELIDRHGESDYLPLLDGENQIDNVVFLATTNRPEKLSRRFFDRPSRFDEIVKVGMPSEEARRMYLRAKVPAALLADEALERWVAETKDFGIAHLRDLVNCVFCLDRDYAETVARLRSMKKPPKNEGGGEVGFK